jgi:hypothetical protein
MTERAKCWDVIFRKDIDGKKIKYSLGNAVENRPLERLDNMQCQRYMIKCLFEEGKNQCGICDNQVGAGEAGTTT